MDERRVNVELVVWILPVASLSHSDSLCLVLTHEELTFEVRHLRVQLVSGRQSLLTRKGCRLSVHNLTAFTG